MPNCFQLFKRWDTLDAADLPAVPVTLAKVDEELCSMLGVAVHPKRYVAGWFDSIGFLIAMGKGKLGTESLRVAVHLWYFPIDYPPLDTAIEEYEIAKRILSHLEQHYTSDAWAQIGRR